jgi:hypothetical protein
VAGGALVLIDKNLTLRKYCKIAFTAKSIASRPIEAPISRLPARTLSLSSLLSLQAFCLRLAGLILLLLTVWLAGLNALSLKFSQPAIKLSWIVAKSGRRELADKYTTLKTALRAAKKVK